MTTWGAIDLGPWPALGEARRISRKLNDQQWMDSVLVELGAAINFAKDHHEDWQQAVVDALGKGLAWGSHTDRDTLIQFLTDHGLSVRRIQALLVPPVSIGTISGKKGD